MNVTAYLVLGRKGAGHPPRVRRATQKRPSLDYDEALIRLQLEIPDDAFDAPLFTVPVEKRQIAVGVEADDVHEEDDE